MAAHPVELGQTGIVVAPLGVAAMSWGMKRTLAHGGADSEQRRKLS